MTKIGNYENRSLFSRFPSSTVSPQAQLSSLAQFTGGSAGFSRPLLSCKHIECFFFFVFFFFFFSFFFFFFSFSPTPSHGYSVFGVMVGGKGAPTRIGSMRTNPLVVIHWSSTPLPLSFPAGLRRIGGSDLLGGAPLKNRKPKRQNRLWYWEIFSRGPKINMVHKPNAPF